MIGKEARRSSRSWRRVGRAVLTGTVVLWAGAGLPADDDAPTIMMVEEDWQVVLNEPEAELDTPQFHTVISPYPELESYHAQICWNYRESPNFFAGGVQLLAWDGESNVGQKSFREDQLSHYAETVSWTQRMSTNGEMLIFQVANGTSSTWGSFGGWEATLLGDPGVPTLNGYSPATSVANSWISYGANRVDLLQITEVRYYNEQGVLVMRDTTPKVVYEHQD